MSHAALASRLRPTVRTIEELTQGKAPLRQPTAVALARIAGIEASFWTNAERLFRRRAARLRLVPDNEPALSAN